MLDFLFPSNCILCKKLGKPICVDCVAALGFELHKHEQPLPIWYLSHYTEELGKVLTAIKDKGLTALIANLVNQTFWPQELERITLVPVPSSPANYKKRGFSHTQLIAKSLARGNSQLRVENLLQSSRNREDQTELTGSERKDNLVGAFRLARRVQPQKQVVLVDDICTTGATLNSAKKCLEEAGLAVIGAWVVAKVGLEP